MGGRYGPYVKWEKVNATLPKEIDPETVTLEKALALIAAKATKAGGKKKSAPKAAAAKKPAVKKPAAQEGHRQGGDQGRVRRQSGRQGLNQGRNQGPRQGPRQGREDSAQPNSNLTAASPVFHAGALLPAVRELAGITGAWDPIQAASSGGNRDSSERTDTIPSEIWRASPGWEARGKGGSHGRRATECKCSRRLSRRGRAANSCYRSWRPEAPPRAVVAICHGVNSHSGHYVWAAELMVRAGHAVYALDLRGRGRSDGERFFVETVDDYVGDLGALIDHAAAREPGLPIFLLGHSAGGVTSCIYVLGHQAGSPGSSARASPSASRHPISRWRC